MRQSDVKVDEDELKQVEAIIHSMTRHERRNPDIIDGSRRRAHRQGQRHDHAGGQQLLNQFKQMQKMMKQMGGWTARASRRAACAA